MLIQPQRLSDHAAAQPGTPLAADPGGRKLHVLRVPFQATSLARPAWGGGKRAPGKSRDLWIWPCFPKERRACAANQAADN